jgi:hypothetical protein
MMLYYNMLFIIDCLNLLFFTIQPRNNNVQNDNKIIITKKNKKCLYDKNNKYNKSRYIIFLNCNRRLYVNNILFV